VVKSRIDQGHADIGCPQCDARWRISEGARQARASNPSVERELVALKTQIEERKREDMQDIRAASKPIKLFLSYAHSDEPLRQELLGMAHRLEHCRRCRQTPHRSLSGQIVMRRTRTSLKACARLSKRYCALRYQEKQQPAR